MATQPVLSLFLPNTGVVSGVSAATVVVGVAVVEGGEALSDISPSLPLTPHSMWGSLEQTSLQVPSSCGEGKQTSFNTRLHRILALPGSVGSRLAGGVIEEPTAASIG